MTEETLLKQLRRQARKECPLCYGGECIIRERRVAQKLVNLPCEPIDSAGNVCRHLCETKGCAKILAEWQARSSRKLCETCQRPFIPSSNRQRYCEACAIRRRRAKEAERLRKRRAK